MKFIAQAIVVFCFVAIAWAICTPIDAIQELARRRRLAKMTWLDDEAFLSAIRAVESGGNPRAIGPHGEMSAYQFTAATWHLHTAAPFMAWTQSPAYADKIARAHLAYLHRRVIEAGRVADACTLALAWRYGPGFVTADGLLCDYQQRVLALYNDARRKAE